MALAKVTLLDGSVLELSVDRNIKGLALKDAICDSLYIVEKKYFGVLYATMTDTRTWLDLELPVSKLFKSDPWNVRFAVKFYPTEPIRVDEVTRHFLCLQVQNDILEKRLFCSFEKQAVLDSYLVQCAMGNYDEIAHSDSSYLSDFFVSDETTEFKNSVMGLHKMNRGKTLDEAIMHYIEIAKELSMYGADLYAAKDSKGLDVTLGVSLTGILVYRDELNEDHFSWPTILKVSCKKKDFYIILRPTEFKPKESHNTIVFKLVDNYAAEKLWNTCVEHHQFFNKMANDRLTEENEKNKPISRTFNTDFSAETIDATIKFLEEERYSSQVSEPKKKHVKILNIISKFNAKTKHIDIENGTVEHTTGILNTDTGRIETKYGIVDPKKSIVEVWNPQTGHTDFYPISVDAKTGNIRVTSGVSDPNTGIIDDSLGQVMSIAPQDKTVIDVTSIVGTLDTKTGKVDIVNGAFERSTGLLDLENDIVETKYGSIDFKSGELKAFDPKTEKIIIKQAKYNPSGGLFTIPGAIDSKTGQNNPSLGQLVSLGASIDPVVEITSIKGSTIDNSTGQINYTTGKIDTKYGQIDLVNNTITSNDAITGVTKIEHIKVDPITGHIAINEERTLSLKITNKLRHGETDQVVSSAEGKEVIVDPKTQQIWIADGKDPKSNQTKYSSSKVDSKTSTITIVYGLFNPKTNQIEQQTNVDANVCIVNDDGVLFTSTGETDITTNEPLYAASIIQPGNKNFVTKISKVDKKTGKIIFIRLDHPKTSQWKVPLSDLKKKHVKIFNIVSAIDPITKNINIENGTVEHSTGILNTDTGRIETKYGIVDPKIGTVEVCDSQSGRIEIYPIKFDPITGNIHIISGVFNPSTGVIDNSLGQVMCIVPQDKTVIDIASIVGKLDTKNGNVDTINGVFERSSGLLDMENDMVETKYGIIDMKSGEVKTFDPKTEKVTTNPAKYNPAKGSFILTGAIDFKTGKIDPNLGRLVSLGASIDPVVEITSINESIIDNSTGQINTNTGKIDTKYGQIDLAVKTVTLSNPISGKIITKDISIDLKTGQININNERILSLKIVNKRLHPVTGDFTSSTEGKEIIVDSQTQQIWIADGKDPKTNEVRYTSSQIDPKTGTITIIYGLFNPKTNEVEQQFKVDPNVCIVNDDGIVFTSTGEINTATNEPIFSATIIQPGNKNYVTRIAEVDKKTGKMNFIRLDRPKADNLLMLKGQPISNKQLPKSRKLVKKEQHSTDDSTGNTFPINQNAVNEPPKSAKSVPDIPVEIALDLEASKKKIFLQIVTLTGKIDTTTSKINIEMAQLERSLGMFDVASGTISTKYGQINLIAKEIKQLTDLKAKPVQIDPLTGNISIVGVVDPKTGYCANDFGHVISLGSEMDSIVDVISVSGKFKPKKGMIEKKSAVVDVSSGRIDPKTFKIRTIYGVLDLFSNSIAYKHPKTDVLETKDFALDPITGHIILTNEINPKSQEHDNSYGRILSLRIAHCKLDANKVSSSAITAQDIIFNLETSQIWAPESGDKISNEMEYTSTKVDLRTGYIVTLYGILNPKTNQITNKFNVESNNIKIDPITGQLFVATGQVNESTGEPLFAITQVDDETGEIYTKVGKVDSKTGNLVLIKIILITQKDECGISKEIDASNFDYNPNTGKIQNIFNKTFYVYNMVDAATGEVVQVDANDPRLAGPGTTTIQTMTLTGEIDPITGFVKTKYGHIHPETGDIDPATAIKDPVTGKLILSYAEINPSHFNIDVTAVEETGPIRCPPRLKAAQEKKTH